MAFVLCVGVAFAPKCMAISLIVGAFLLDPAPLLLLDETRETRPLRRGIVLDKGRERPEMI